MKATRARALLSLLFLSLFVSGCSSSKARDESTVEFLLPAAIETMDPRDAVDAYSLRATRLLHAGITRLDSETLEPRPDVARSWVWTDPRTLVVELDDARKFREAQRVVRGADVCASIDAFATSRQRHVVDVVESCEARASGVTLHLRRPHPSLVAGLELPILREDQAHAPPRPDGSLDGLGPFRVASVNHGDVELSAADPGAKTVKRVALRAVQDETARAMRLIAGRADIVQNGFALPLADEITRTASVHATLHAAANLTYVVLNNESPYFRGVDQRRAFAAAIPRQALASAFFGDRASVATSLLPASHWAYAPTGCAELGVDAPPYEAPTREPLRLLVSTDRFRRTVGRAVTQALGDHGIAAEIVSVELGTMLGRLSTGDFDAALLQLPEIAEPDVLRVFLHGASVPPAGSNRGRVHDSELDALFDRAGSTVLRDERIAVYGAAFSRVCERAYIVPLWQEQHVVLTSARAAAYTPSADGRWNALATLMK